MAKDEPADPRLPRGPSWAAQVGPGRAEDIAERLAAEESTETTLEASGRWPSAQPPPGLYPPPQSAGPAWGTGELPIATPVYGGPPLQPLPPPQPDRDQWFSGPRRGWLRRLFRR